MIVKINEIPEARQAAIDDDESDYEVEFDADVASVAHSRSLKMTVLIVVERSP